MCRSLPRVGLVFGQELEVVGRGAEQEPREANPVGGVGRAEQRLQVVAAAVRRRPQVDLLRRPLQQPHRHVAVRERLPLEQEAPRSLHALQKKTKNKNKTQKQQQQQK